MNNYSLLALIVTVLFSFIQGHILSVLVQNLQIVALYVMK